MLGNSKNSIYLTNVSIRHPFHSTLGVPIHVFFAFVKPSSYGLSLYLISYEKGITHSQKKHKSKKFPCSMF